MRHIYQTNLEILLRGNRSLSVEVAPDVQLTTDSEGKLTSLRWSSPAGEPLTRLLYLDPSEVVSITASDYWEGYDEEPEELDAEAEQVPEEPEQPDQLQTAALVEPDDYGRLPMTVEVRAAIAEVERLMGQTDAR